MDEATRAFAVRCQRQMNGVVPEMNHAGIYSAVLHCVKAVRDTGSISGAAVVARMKQLSLDDFWNKNVTIRQDGRVLNDMHLMQVKTPDESRGPNDTLKQLAVVPGGEAFQPLSASKCPLIAKTD